MATVMNTHGSQHHVTHKRTVTQKACIGIGIVFLAAGILGLFMPGLLELHLSTAHNVIHLLSGALALWCGYADRPKYSYNFCLGFGIVYAGLGVTGFAFGDPGYPGVGYLAADENLLRIIPNVLEFGTRDHVFHLILSVALLISALGWKNEITDQKTKTQVFRDFDRVNEAYRMDTLDTYRNGPADIPNSDSDLKDAPLGRSDVYHRSDDRRRTDFERRV